MYLYIYGNGDLLTRTTFDSNYYEPGLLSIVDISVVPPMEHDLGGWHEIEPEG